jgi:hypothetical protein
MDAAVTSDVLYSSEFKSLSRQIVPALLYNLIDSDDETFNFVKQESVDFLSLFVLELQSLTVFFRADRIEADTKALDRMYRPPLADRRARSIRATKRDEKGPEHRDVALSALRIFRSLFRLSHSVQIAQTLVATVEFLDAHEGGALWTNPGWCCWLVETMTKWTHLQYRFVLLSFFLDQLVALGSQAGQVTKQTTLCSIIKTILTSRASLVGLAIGDVLAQLITLIIRRARLSQDDPLLQPVADCIIGLASHVYYSDQICDIAQDIIATVTVLQLQGEPGEDAPAADAKKMRRSARDVSTCVLIQCLVGVFKAARCDGKRLSSLKSVRDSEVTLEVHEADKPVEGAATKKSVERKSTDSQRTKGHAKEDDRRDSAQKRRTRNRVPPDVFSDILVLLSEGSQQVRLACAHAIIAYVCDELPLGESISPESKPVATRPVTEDACKRLVNSIHANAYLLISQQPRSSSRQTETRTTSSSSRSSSVADGPKPTAADFTAIREIFVALFSKRSAMVLITGIPALKALVRHSTVEDLASTNPAEKQLAILQIVSSVLRVISDTWGLTTPRREAEKVWKVHSEVATILLTSFFLL